jgi:hypothetical protein
MTTLNRSSPRYSVQAPIAERDGRDRVEQHDALARLRRRAPLPQVVSDDQRGRGDDQRSGHQAEQPYPAHVAREHPEPGRREHVGRGAEGRDERA